MKIVMKVVCINDSSYDDWTNNKLQKIYLTKGKSYEVLDYGKNFSYLVTGDKGNLHRVLKERFLTIEEYRQKILNNILE